MNAYRKGFDETKSVSFLIKDDKLLEKYDEVWQKVRNIIYKEIIIFKCFLWNANMLLRKKGFIIKLLMTYKYFQIMKTLMKKILLTKILVRNILVKKILVKKLNFFKTHK